MGRREAMASVEPGSLARAGQVSASRQIWLIIINSKALCSDYEVEVRGKEMRDLGNDRRP